jgi:hypothetical protein
MGDWKAPLSLRVRQALRADLEALAARERRTLGNVGELILEWGFEQLKVAGSTERLLESRICPPDAPVRRRKVKN